MTVSCPFSLSYLVSSTIVITSALLGGCNLGQLMDYYNINRRQQYVNTHPQTKYRQEILEGRVVRGMSVYEMVASLGKPDSTLETGAIAQWRYDHYRRRSETVWVTLGPDKSRIELAREDPLLILVVTNVLHHTYQAPVY